MEFEGAGPPKLRIGDPFDAEVLDDEMNPEGKSKLLPIRMKRCDGPAITCASVVTVNDQEIPPIDLELTGSVLL
jgi:hypothetical protein